MPKTQLASLLYHDFISGMFWENAPEWDLKRNVYTFRVLLHNKHMVKLYKSLRLAARIGGGLRLPSLKKSCIAEAFGMIYERASYNVKQCATLDPVPFFAEMMKAFAWADPISPELFWKFTYRAHMARALFLEYQPGSAHAPRSDLVKYPDSYKQAFYREYDQRYGADYLDLPASEQDLQEVDRIKTRREEIFGATKLYFPFELTCAEYNGDGTDRTVVVKERNDRALNHILQRQNGTHETSQARQDRGIRENWLREDGSANPFFMSNEIHEAIEECDESDDDSEQAEEADEPDTDDYDDEYQRELLEYELEHDVYMGRHARNPEEDT
ncbi:hypothetical protein PG994_004870 [Apiospora phragmitis]|uniref:Uncharacterized protein n=1 Tax=Apiospora phragmitis TaxID=2905665 RepID=A0ABR1VUH4_9PEZI